MLNDLTSNYGPRPSRSEPQHNGSKQSTSEPPSPLLLLGDNWIQRKAGQGVIHPCREAWEASHVASGPGLCVSWSHFPNFPSWWASFTCSGPLTRLQVSGLDLPSQPRCSFQLQNPHNLHPNSSFKISYTFDLAEFAQWLGEKKNVKQEKKEKGKKKKRTKQHYQPALISRLFRYCDLGSKEVGGRWKSNTSGRKCLLFRNVI